jgi:hypothetical protein
MEQACQLPDILNTINGPGFTSTFAENSANHRFWRHCQPVLLDGIPQAESAVARRLRAETTMTLAWIAKQLSMMLPAPSPTALRNENQ